MKKVEKWVLAANGSSARIFTLETITKLTEVQAFVHAQSRLHEHDLVSEKPGRSFDSKGPTRHAIEPQHTQKEQELVDFAKQIASFLETAYQQNSFQQLYIIASPNFLGHLRQTLTRQVLDACVKEIAKDVVHASTSEILAQIIK